ncbi:hypothetical protein BDV97DRAFT_398402 [Delphinella strobiligena]|nr:hypothetical protein BDV97DRAFT_398402 [Delphinella strobiligena]
MRKYERQAQSQRKHGPLTISGASKAPAPPPTNRPDWRGPGYVKKRPGRPTPPSAATVAKTQEQPLPVELQQLILNIFRDTFPTSQDFEGLKPTLREINNALTQRDLANAFAKQEFMDAYAVRWSPSRALAYANILAWICSERAEDDWIDRLINGGEENTPAKVVCFGGGAAEMVAFAGLLRHSRREAAGKPDPLQSSRSEAEDVSSTLGSLSLSQTVSPAPRSTLLDLHLIDVANWSSVVSNLHSSLETRPTLSRYASAVARASNTSYLVPQTLRSTFAQKDILSLSVEALRATIGPDPALLTLLFTLNDLYSTSIPKTSSFLLRLTTAAPKGSLLLVIDSPGAHAEPLPTIKQQTETKTETETETEREPQETMKKYPMQRLMDYVLLEKKKAPKKAAADQGSENEAEILALWEKIVDEENMTHKLDEGLRYHMLENIRYQMHFFRRL